jgi:hypothetical protein
MIAGQELIQEMRRRGMVLKFVRRGHQEQLSRMDDFEVWALMQDLGINIGRDQVLTMLQDLQVLGYLSFKQDMNERTGATEISEIELTPKGLGVVFRRKSNEDVLID